MTAPPDPAPVNGRGASSSPSAPGPPPSAGFLRVFGAVFASFLGIRKKSAGERDAVSIKLVHVVLAGLLGAAILVALVLTLVHVVTHVA